MNSMPFGRDNGVSRRRFCIGGGASLLGGMLACSSIGVPQLRAESLQGANQQIPLGFDNFSIRALNWKADRLIEFAGQQQMDALLLSDLDVYENLKSDYLKQLKSKADDLGIVVHAGTGSICSTAKRFTDKWGTAEELLKLGIRVAKELGSPVFRCYLGGENDRHGDGGIQRHIETTVATLKKVKSQAIDANVKIAVENHAGDMQAWELVGLIEQAGTDFVGATIDSGNATWTLESPQSNLELLGPLAVTSGMRDSTVWQTEQGAAVAWNAIGQGQVDWRQYASTFAKLCPNVPFQLEIISGFNKPFAYRDEAFWKAYPDAKARDFERFLQLARKGKAIAPGEANNPEFQMKELMASIEYCKSELGMGLKS